MRGMPSIIIINAISASHGVRGGNFSVIGISMKLGRWAKAAAAASASEEIGLRYRHNLREISIHRRPWPGIAGNGERDDIV